MTAYYNEHDPFAAAWLRNLIDLGQIAPGDVDERSIEDVCPDDLRPYAQCHFFAGIGVWSHALRSAGWDDSRPVWTGSCPCQPFSAAGKGVGFADERHLWPAWFHLITQCGPDVVYGEQVASKDGLAWLDLVQTDMEAARYAFGAFDLCAAGFGAPHIRQRSWWVAVADADTAGFSQQRGVRLQRPEFHDADRRHSHGGMEYPGRTRSAVGLSEPSQRQERVAGVVDDAGRELFGAQRRPALIGLVDADGGNARTEREQRSGEQRLVSRYGGARGLADDGCERIWRGQSGSMESETGGDERTAEQQQWVRPDPSDGGTRNRPGPGPTNGAWGNPDWLCCTDGKWRPVESGTFPLVNGATNRVGALRGYGNAIAAPVAQAFIEVTMEALGRG